MSNRIELKIIKCHGSGNDFSLIDSDDLPANIDLGKLSIALSDRSGLVGSDGILIASDSANFGGKMKMFNTDGSEAQMCGNGVRCTARYLFEKFNATSLDIETKIGSVFCSIEEPIFKGVYSTSASIGKVVLSTKTVPINIDEPTVLNRLIPQLDESALFSAVSIPNPHLVSIVDEIDHDLLNVWGQKIEANSQLFPEGFNVSMVQIIGKNEIYVLTNERGCGITKACGTAISSSSYISARLKIVDTNQSIKIISPGGISYTMIEQIDNKIAKRVQLTGNATFEFDAILELDQVSLKPLSYKGKTVRNGEIQAWENLLKSIDNPN